jgi:hypothetical protein
MLMFSGFLSMADWPQPGVRTVALLSAVHLRHMGGSGAGVFGTTDKTCGDPPYTTCVLAVLTLFGRWLLRDECCRYVMAE